MNTKLRNALFVVGYGFRFLYGRWILPHPLVTPLAESRSDSSMVDEYASTSCSRVTVSSVQIPLWSMNTCLCFFNIVINSGFRFLYGRWIPWVFARTSRLFSSSDSSMVDEYPSRHTGHGKHSSVQIPLWSMNTLPRIGSTAAQTGSDSSMVDEYITSS